jgi:hypothetical protein
MFTAKKHRHSTALSREPTAPCGLDRSGKYWHQRFHADILALDDEARDVILEALQYWPYDRVDSLRILLARFCSASVNEQQSYLEALG